MSRPVSAPAASEIEPAAAVRPISILALDPGGTTGLCRGLYHDHVLKLTPDQRVLGMQEMYEYLDLFLDSMYQVEVIYEDFSYRNRARTGLDLTPVKLIGIIELFRDRHEPLVGFHKQSAATGKGFFTDDKLKDLGVYVKGKQHGRDATRHLLQWANFGAGSAFINMTETKVELV